MTSQFASGQPLRDHFDGRFFQHAGLLALAAAGAGIGVHHGYQLGVFPRALVALQFQGDGFIDQWADAVADVATQTEEIEAVLLIDEHRQAHAGIIDVG